MKKKLIGSVLAIAMVLGISQQANAMVIAVADAFFGAVTFSPGTVAGAAAEFGAGLILFVLTPVSPLLGLIGLVLDDPAGPAGVEKLAQNIESYGASQKEATDLAILLVNANTREQSSGKEITITEADLTTAAPVFSHSAGMLRFLEDNFTQRHVEMK